MQSFNVTLAVPTDKSLPQMTVEFDKESGQVTYIIDPSGKRQVFDSPSQLVQALGSLEEKDDFTVGVNVDISEHSDRKITRTISTELAESMAKLSYYDDDSDSDDSDCEDDDYMNSSYESPSYFDPSTPINWDKLTIEHKGKVMVASDLLKKNVCVNTSCGWTSLDDLIPNCFRSTDVGSQQAR
jgi:hypothetical protein